MAIEVSLSCVLDAPPEAVWERAGRVSGINDELWPFCQTVEEVMRLVKLSSLMVHEPREDGAVAIG